MEFNEKLKKLLIEIADGNRKSFIELMEITQSMLMKTAYAYLYDHMLAEDVVNETYELIISKRHALKNYDNITGWLKTVVINKSINLLHKRKREILSEEIPIRVQSAINTAEKIFVRECLSAMGEPERSTLLYRANGFTLEEIAQIMKFTIKKVRIVIEKAKKEFNRLYRKGDLPDEK